MTGIMCGVMLKEISLSFGYATRLLQLLSFYHQSKEARGGLLQATVSTIPLGSASLLLSLNHRVIIQYLQYSSSHDLVLNTCVCTC